MSKYLKFKIFQMTSDGETTKTKIVDLKKLCNFVVYNFFIWNNLLLQNVVWNYILKLLKNSNFSF
jgi:hypothetical protein